MDRALELHRDAIVVDGHADTIGRFLDDGEDLATETGRGHGENFLRVMEQSIDRRTG